MAKPPKQPPPKGQRPNPLKTPVVTLAAPRRDPLRGPVMGLQTFLHDRSEPEVQRLDLTAHVLHGDHISDVVADVLARRWAAGATLVIRPADDDAAEQLEAALRALLGSRGPRLVRVSD